MVFEDQHEALEAAKHFVDDAVFADAVQLFAADAV